MIAQGPGWHDFVMDEIELGTRVAYALQDSMAWGGMGWYYALLYDQDIKAGRI